MRRLQSVISREIAPTDNAALTVGSLQAGSSANIIPNEAVLQLNIRTFDDQVRVVAHCGSLFSAHAAGPSV